MENLKIPSDVQPIEAIKTTAKNPIALLLLAHGAGAGMNHTFMENLATTLADFDIEVIRFNFAYMTSGKKFPGSPKATIQTWKDVIDWASVDVDLPIFIGGKSYGGRMASHALVENDFQKIYGVLYFGFPLHAPGRDSIKRADHLAQVTISQLFLQGTRDALANLDRIKHVIKPLKNATLTEIAGGDHSFKVKGAKPQDIISQLAETAAAWMKSVSEGSPNKKRLI